MWLGSHMMFQVGHGHLQGDGDFPHRCIAVFLLTVATESPVYGPNWRIRCFAHPFNGAHPQRQVSVHGVLDENRYVGSLESRGDFLNGEWTHRGAGSDPQHIDSRVQTGFYVLGVGHFGCHRDAGFHARL